MRYICINGHDDNKPGRVIGWYLGFTVHECRFPTCHAEAESVTEAERDQIKTHRDAVYTRLVSQSATPGDVANLR